MYGIGSCDVVDIQESDTQSHSRLIHIKTPRVVAPCIMTAQLLAHEAWPAIMAWCAAREDQSYIRCACLLMQHRHRQGAMHTLTTSKGPVATGPMQAAEKPDPMDCSGVSCMPSPSVFPAPGAGALFFSCCAGRKRLMHFSTESHSSTALRQGF